MKIRLVSFVLAAAVTAISVVPASAQTPRPQPDTRFGIAEGFRRQEVMQDIAAGWTRLVFSWNDIQPDGPNDFRRLGLTLPNQELQTLLNRGVKVSGLIQFTPGWAQRDPAFGQRSVPKNLNLSIENPENYFARYVTEVTKHYAGRVDEWIIWNEPEFRPEDPGAGESYTWRGSEEEFAQLTKVGYLAAKRGNPNARVSFAGTAFWIDQNQGRPQYYERVLDVIARDPQAASNNFFHDAVSLNLYRAPDDMVRVHQVFKDIQKKFGFDKPVWLTETNAMPTDDMAIPCADRHARTQPRTTMEQQAAYGIQAFALAASVGFERIEFYQMVDSDSCREPAVWGVTRDNGERRPVAQALKTGVWNMSGFTKAQFVPLTGEPSRVTEQGNPVPTWPNDPRAIYYNWHVYQVAFDKPGDQRVSVLWNGDAAPAVTRVRKNGSSAKVIDRWGNESPLAENQGWWVVTLPGATARGQITIGNQTFSDAEGYHFIGGDPLLIVEEGVTPDTPVVAPRLGDPASAVREFRLFPTNTAETIARGQSVEFFFGTRGYEEFNEPISLRVSQWSTQRFPNPRGGDSFPLGVTFTPGNVVNPGDTVSLRVDSSSAPDGGIYFFSIEATAGGITKTIDDLALVIN